MIIKYIKYSDSNALQPTYIKTCFSRLLVFVDVYYTTSDI